MRWFHCLFAGLILAAGCRGSDYPLRRVAYSEIVGAASIEVLTPPSIKRGERFAVPIVIDIASVTMPKVVPVGGRLQITRQSATLGSYEIDVLFDPAVLKLDPLGSAGNYHEAGVVTLSAEPGSRSGLITVATLDFEVIGGGEMTTITITPKKFLTPQIPGLGSYSIPDRGSTISVLFFSNAGEAASRARPEKR